MGVEVMGMPTSNRRLELRVEDGAQPRSIVCKREFIPPYAETLQRRGRARTGRGRDPKRPDRVTIDWPAAAQAAAG